LLLAVFAPDVLRLWLGQDFAARSAPALRLLSLGVLINGLSHIPCGYLQASGRPDVPAKFHLVEIALHVPLTIFLVQRYGITGAALAWTLRVSVDSALLFGATDRILSISPWRVFGGRGGRVTAALAAFVLALLAISRAHLPLLATAALCGGSLVAFSALVWRVVLDAGERFAVGRALALTRRTAARAAPASTR
jgi:O-antigen/teichoic acid export membrane protein